MITNEDRIFMREAIRLAEESLDSTTGIEGVGEGQWTTDNRQRTTDDSPIYNLAGQKVSGNLPKGIYIVNGKKILK